MTHALAISICDNFVFRVSYRESRHEESCVRACVYPSVRPSARVSCKSFTRLTAATFPIMVMDESCLPFSSVLGNCRRSRLSIPSSARLRVFGHGAPANADRRNRRRSSRRTDGVDTNSARERNYQRHFTESGKSINWTDLEY